MLDRLEAMLLQRLDQSVTLLLRHPNVVGSTLIIVLHLKIQLANYIIKQARGGHRSLTRASDQRWTLHF